MSDTDPDDAPPPHEILAARIARDLRRRNALTVSPALGAAAAAEGTPARRRALVGARLQLLRRKLAAMEGRATAEQPAPPARDADPEPDPGATRPARRRSAVRGMDLQDAAALLSSAAFEVDDEEDEKDDDT